MSSQQLRALIVDDDSIVRRTLEFALGKEGFSCSQAADGVEALARLHLILNSGCPPSRSKSRRRQTSPPTAAEHRPCRPKARRLLPAVVLAGRNRRPRRRQR